MTEPRPITEEIYSLEGDPLEPSMPSPHPLDVPLSDIGENVIPLTKSPEEQLDALQEKTGLAKNIDRDKMVPHESKYEKPIHRIMCALSAQGETPLEIAKKCNYGVAQVRNIIKSERSRLMIAQIIADTHGESVADLLKGGAVDAVMRIRNLSVSAKSESVQLSSAKDILDRVQGKPTPALPDSASTTPVDAKTELDELKAQIKRFEDKDKKTE